jgi:hypothetical protein
VGHLPVVNGLSSHARAQTQFWLVSDGNGLGNSGADLEFQIMTWLCIFNLTKYLLYCTSYIEIILGQLFKNCNQKHQDSVNNWPMI